MVICGTYKTWLRNKELEVLVSSITDPICLIYNACPLLTNNLYNQYKLERRRLFKSLVIWFMAPLSIYQEIASTSSGVRVGVGGSRNNKEIKTIPNNIYKKR